MQQVFGKSNPSRSFPAEEFYHIKWLYTDRCYSGYFTQEVTKKDRDELFEIFCKKYGRPLGAGRHRCTFESKNVVVKLPMSADACMANQQEFEVSRGNGRTKYAKVKLKYIKGFPIVFMEKLDAAVVESIKEKPGWVDFIDCQQVGVARDGKLLAYDFSLI